MAEGGEFKNFSDPKYLKMSIIIALGYACTPDIDRCITMTNNPYYRETSLYLWDINGPGYSFPVLDERLFTLPHRTKLYGSGTPERAKLISSVGQKCGK